MLKWSLTLVLAAALVSLLGWSGLATGAAGIGNVAYVAILVLFATTMILALLGIGVGPTE